MGLPPELRREIFKHHLVSPRALHVTSCNESRPQGYQNRRNHISSLTLLLTSKSVYNEAMPLFYLDNTLHFEGYKFQPFKCLINFLDSLSQDRRQYITSISLVYQGMSSPHAFRLLAGCERLRHISLKVGNFTLRGQPRTDWKLVKAQGMKDLIKLRGLQTVKIIHNPYYPVVDKQKWETQLEAMRAALQVLKHPKSIHSVKTNKKHTKSGNKVAAFASKRVTADKRVEG